MPIRPLTHTTTQGVLYHRRPEIEAQIAATAGLADAELERRAAIADPSDAEYLRDETLFYHLREASRGSNKARAIALWPAFNARCAVYARYPLRSLAPEDAEDGLAQVMERLIRLIDAGGDAADYCEVSFRQFFSSRMLDAFGKANNERNLAVKRARLTDDREYDEDGGASGAAHISGGGWDEEAVLRSLMGEQALREMETFFQGDSRRYQAFLLRHVEGRAIGPRTTTGTLANLFDVTERTINNWMRSVEAFLADWRKRNLK